MFDIYKLTIAAVLDRFLSLPLSHEGCNWHYFVLFCVKILLFRLYVVTERLTPLVGYVANLHRNDAAFGVLNQKESRLFFRSFQTLISFIYFIYSFGYSFNVTSKVWSHRSQLLVELVNS